MNGLTRRSFLGGVAGASVVSLPRPAPGIEEREDPYKSIPKYIDKLRACIAG